MGEISFIFKKMLYPFLWISLHRLTKATDDHPELKKNTLKDDIMVYAPESRMLFGKWKVWVSDTGTCYQLQTESAVTSTCERKTIFHLCTSWSIMQWVNASTELHVCIWEGKCLHLFAVEGRGWLIFVAPVTRHCFLSQTTASVNKDGERKMYCGRVLFPPRHL